MAIEEAFGIEIPDVDPDAFDGPRDMLDWLAVHLLGKCISKQAALLLENLAQVPLARAYPE
jgi:hypothetical protein